jgi:Domain of unknown function (DUF4760)
VLCTWGSLGLWAWLNCISAPDPIWKLLLAFLTPALVVVSLILAARSIANTRAVARQKATIDLIEKVESTAHYRDLAAAFITARDTGKMGKLGDPHNAGDRLLRRQVLGYLNHYELIAIGIEDNILDDAIYRKWMQASAVADWNDALLFIQAERWRLNEARAAFVYHSEIFVRFQRATSRWSAKAITLDEAWGERPVLPVGEPGPGDEPRPETRPVPD